MSRFTNARVVESILWAIRLSEFVRSRNRAKIDALAGVLLPTA